MMKSEEIKKRILAHYEKYPQLELQDVFKYVYQSSFGCEHLLASEERAREYIKREYAECRGIAQGIDKLDGPYSRVSLSCLDSGLAPETLARIFCLSAKKEESGAKELESKLCCVRVMIDEGCLPFSSEDFENSLKVWDEAGYPAIHHSQRFRDLYHPAYRVIADEFVQFLPLFSKIDKLLEHGKVILAVEGGSASGKSTLSEMLSKIYDCTLFHMDDFFLRPEQRTTERLAEIGGNVDRERFLSEVLLPLSEQRTVKYRKFDCSSGSLGELEAFEPKKLTVIEGVYSMHPELARFYDLSVFLDISPELQRARIEKRNSPSFAARFFDTWIPMENKYFGVTGAESRCSLSIEIK